MSTVSQGLRIIHPLTQSPTKAQEGVHWRLTASREMACQTRTLIQGVVSPAAVVVVSPQVAGAALHREEL